MKTAKAILVPIDFSDSAIEALEWGATSARPIEGSGWN